MFKFSLIIPVYNRPDELEELLFSLTKQVFDTQKIVFEVIVIEDGSTQKADFLVDKFKEKLELYYFFKENTGQGFSRNVGFEKAKGDYFIVFDSDCIIPDNYLQTVFVNIQKSKLDAFGGPDKAHESFTDVQKAISYAMTSIFSTGGIRGNKKSAEKFRPRSFNMGISKQVFQKVGGYKITRMGEDIEFSIRIEKNGFKVGLIPDAFVYHKRRTNFYQFYKQLHFFGRARINVRRFFPKELKLVHTFPAFFVLGLLFLPISFLIDISFGMLISLMFLFYFLIIFTDAMRVTKNLKISFLSVYAVFIQLLGYGIGFLSEIIKKK
ncbi:MAG: glycosyltransferase [Bacteroidetes bacterium]|nr:MAG: glycosyltransferase [Bacteroidota bacterium]